MSRQKELEEKLLSLIDSEYPLSSKEVYEVSRISFELGKASVYNENGWTYFDESD